MRMPRDAGGAKNVLSASEVAGFLGGILAGAAYVPQIVHLVRERCSAGISRAAFGIWLASSALVAIHAIAIRAWVFIFLGAVQMAAIAVILVHSTRYAGSYCETHRGSARNRAWTFGSAISELRSLVEDRSLTSLRLRKRSAAS
jgi:uncharacterized protein with PQ loop repeat